MLDRRLALIAAFAALAALALLAAVAAHSWLAARDARARLDATLLVNKHFIEQIEAREKERAERLRDSLAQIEQLKKRVRTPREIVRELPRALPLPQPIEITLPEPAPNAPPHTPPPAAIATIPQEDLKPLFDFVQDCRACTVRLDAATEDLRDARARAAALTAQRDAALHAARGGRFWSRARSAAKWFVLGAAVGAVAAASR